ncbi:Uncharacterised protein [BD1-7 clade bacterium]|nr:Uncharacterised protein [BD1-7 clade bacterium]
MNTQRVWPTKPSRQDSLSLLAGFVLLLGIGSALPAQAIDPDPDPNDEYPNLFIYMPKTDGDLLEVERLDFVSNPNSIYIAEKTESQPKDRPKVVTSIAPQITYKGDKLDGIKITLLVENLSGDNNGGFNTPLVNSFLTRTISTRDKPVSNDIADNFAYSPDFDAFHSCFLMREASKDDFIFSGKLVLDSDQYLMRGELSVLREFYERPLCGEDLSDPAHAIVLGSNDGTYLTGSSHAIHICGPDGTQYRIEIKPDERNVFFIYRDGTLTCEESVPEADLPMYQWNQ